MLRPAAGPRQSASVPWTACSCAATKGGQFPLGLPPSFFLPCPQTLQHTTVSEERDQRLAPDVSKTKGWLERQRADKERTEGWLGEDAPGRGVGPARPLLWLSCLATDTVSVVRHCQRRWMDRVLGLQAGLPDNCGPPWVSTCAHYGLKRARASQAPSEVLGVHGRSGTTLAGFC
jgi:hypothetical protein